MNPIDLIAWTANILFVLTYVFILLKIVDGEKIPYSALILTAVTCYAIYSLIGGYYPMLALNIVNIFFGIRTIYRLTYHPEKKYKYHPVLFHVVLILAGTILAIATKASAIEIFTWIGGGFFLSAYALISSGKISADGVTFNLMYMIAAGFYMVWGIVIGNMPIIAIETFLIVTSLLAIFKEQIMKLRRKLNNH